MGVILLAFCLGCYFYYLSPNFLIFYHDGNGTSTRKIIIDLF
jgi:hypothetical protein